MRLQEGSDTSISDITNAAGWEILGCDGKSTDPQDIRLVCTNPDKQCDSLFKGGAENTLIRLPNSVGTNLSHLFLEDTHHTL